MKLKLTLFVLTIAAIVLLNTRNETSKREVTEFNGQQDGTVQLNRKPAVNDKNKKPATPRTDIAPATPDEEGPEIKIEPSLTQIKLPEHLLRGATTVSSRFQIISSLRAISEKDFRPSMGRVVQNKGGMVFFQSNEGPRLQASNVAYDAINGGVYPVSSVIKLRHVGPEMRDKILEEGLEEQYYHEGLKILYVKGPHEEVLPLYKEFISKKLDAHVEVIEAYHRPR